MLKHNLPLPTNRNPTMRYPRTPWILWMAGAACLTATAARLPAESPSAEDKWVEVLKSNVPAAQKCNACRELRTAGTEKSIPVLAGLLTDAETSHAARFALEAMPYPAAGAAPREAAGKATGLTRSGILDSLGQRRDPEAVPVLAAALVDPDPQVVAAAAVALGKIGTVEAAGALTAARAKARDKARTAVDDGLLLAADRLLAAGQRDLAAKIYRDLASPDEPPRSAKRLARRRASRRPAGGPGGPGVAGQQRRDGPRRRGRRVGESFAGRPSYRGGRHGEAPCQEPVVDPDGDSRSW